MTATTNTYNRAAQPGDIGVLVVPVNGQRASDIIPAGTYVMVLKSEYCSAVVMTMLTVVYSLPGSRRKETVVYPWELAPVGSPMQPATPEPA